MALLHRFSRLLSADLHAVLDRLEDPELLLDQAQREMRSVIEAEQHQLKRSAAQQSRLQGQLDSHSAKLAACDSELDLCFDANDEALARSVIKRKLQAEAAMQRLEAELAAVQQQHAVLAQSLDAHQRDLRAIAVEVEQLLSTSEPPLPTVADAERGVNEDAVELALLAERRARKERS